VWVHAVPLVAVALAMIGACSSPKRTSNPDEWASRAELNGDWDQAEDRWRQEIAANPWSEPDMNLLTDDPPAAPEAYGATPADQEAKPVDGGAVAVADASQDPNAQSDQFWGDVGKASFSAFTVLFTVGMAVAPYLLF
jgi:hypothetical protein